MAQMENALLRIVNHLTDALGDEGWSIRWSTNGARARWRWLSVSLKHRPDKNPEAPWRVRLRDGFPRYSVIEQWAADPIEPLDAVIAQAREVRRFVEGGSGLVRNPSKSWLAHRVWEAVRPHHGCRS